MILFQSSLAGPRINSISYTYYIQFKSLKEGREKNYCKFLISHENQCSILQLNFCMKSREYKNRKTGIIFSFCFHLSENFLKI